MKNNNLKELKPIYIHELEVSNDNEAGLVDLAIVLYRHKILITFMIFISISIGVVYTLKKTTTYTYGSTIEIGSQIINGRPSPLESPETLLAKINYNFIPQVLNDLKSSSPKDKSNYNIKLNIPKNSEIIILKTQGKEKQTDSIIRILNSITEKAIQDHNRIYQSIKISLKTRLNQATANLKSLKNSKSEITANQNLLNLIESLEIQLVNLRSTRQVLPPIKPQNTKSDNQTMIIIISAFTGLLLGISAALIIEFISKVKQKLATDNK